MANYCEGHLTDAARLYIADAGNKAVTVRLIDYGIAGLDMREAVCAYCHAPPQFVLTNVPREE